MKFGLFHKLLGAFVVASFASIILFGGTAFWYMGKSFLKYINEAREAHLEVMAEHLAEHFQREQDWDALAGQERRWRRLTKSLKQVTLEELSDRPRPPDAHFPPGGPPGRKRPLPTLYDADKRVLVGPEDHDFGQSTTMPIVADGRTVGYVGLPPLKRPMAHRDKNFARGQKHFFLTAAGAILMFAFGVAWLTARWAARPVRTIRDGARTLASGDFETRLPSMGNDEIGQLAADFNRLALTLEQNESARRRWIADVSHELRTPLAIMRGELDAVQDGVRQADERFIESIEQEAARLHQLIEDLYQLARADVGSLDYSFEPVSISSVITESLNRFAHRFEDAELKWRYDLAADATVHVDTKRMSQLFENIFENCLRYVNAPGSVLVSLARTESSVCVTIDDTGPGVAQDALASLFDPLSRVESSRSREHGGAGLGLAICRKIAEGHNGSITAQTSPEGGLRIRLDLPVD